VIDYALEGSYKIDGVESHPSFHLLKENLRKYTLEWVSNISGVAADTIRRIATEFAHAAQVGSTITIDGHQLPLRPVSSVTLRGGIAHENALSVSGQQGAQAIAFMNAPSPAMRLQGVCPKNKCWNWLNLYPMERVLENW